MRMVMSVMVVAGMIVGSAQAALTTSEELHVGSSNDFPVSATDLINIGQCIQSYEGNGGNDSAVIDGSSGLENYWGGYAFVYGTNYVSVAVLDTTKDPQGYNIQQIDFYQGWNGASGVDVIINSIEYQQVGSDTWITLIENSPHYLYDSQDPDVYQWSKVSVFDTTGADLATNVKSIRFTLGTNAVIREIDVFGEPVSGPLPTPTPTPTPTPSNGIVLTDNFENGLGQWSVAGASLASIGVGEHAVRTTPDTYIVWRPGDTASHQYLELVVDEKHLTQSDQNGQALQIRMPGGLCIAPMACFSWGQGVYIWNGNSWVTAFGLDTSRFNLVETWNTWRLVENGTAAAVYLNNEKVWEDPNFSPNYDWDYVQLRYKAGQPTGDYAEFDNVMLLDSPMVTVQGTVAPQNYTGDNTTLRAKVVFSPTSGADNITRLISPEADGSFSLSIPAGTYNVTVTGDCWLEVAYSDVTISANPTVLPFPIVLRGADASGNNKVGFEDFSIL